MLDAFNARRTAIISAVLTAVAFVQAPAREGEVGIVTVLGAVGAGLVAYAAAYQAIGLTEKVAVGAVVGALAAVGSGLVAGDDAVSIAIATILVIGAKIGVEFALPSTEGSATGELASIEALVVE